MTDILDPDYESDLTEEEHNKLVLMSEHAIAPPLSPAAQAVMGAVVKVYPAFPDEVAAAAIRAAADQVVPVPITAKTPEEHWTKLGIKNQLLAIADELEGQ